MWIRVQNKDKLVNVNSFEVNKFIKDGNYGYDVPEKEFLKNDYYISSPEAGIIGIYKTKERALNVLSDIQAFIENNYLSINDMPSHSNSPYPHYFPLGFTIMTNKKIYQMPKDN